MRGTEAYMTPPDEIPKTLVVPGRGLEPTTAGTHAGTLQYDSPASGDGYDRAVAAAEYTKNHSEVGKVIFTGDRTFALAPSAVPQGSEAQAGADVAKSKGLPDSKITVLKRARSTYGNWLEVLESDELDLNEVIGVVVQKNHAERALKIGAFVIPHARFMVIEADNTSREGYSSTPTFNDLLSSIAFGVYMARTKAGDVEKIRRQDEKVQKRVVQIQTVARFLGRAASRATRYVKAS